MPVLAAFAVVTVYFFGSFGLTYEAVKLAQPTTINADGIEMARGEAIHTQNMQQYVTHTEASFWHETSYMLPSAVTCTSRDPVPRSPRPLVVWAVYSTILFTSPFVSMAVPWEDALSTLANAFSNSGTSTAPMSTFSALLVLGFARIVFGGKFFTVIFIIYAFVTRGDAGRPFSCSCCEEAGASGPFPTVRSIDFLGKCYHFKAGFQRLPSQSGSW